MRKFGRVALRVVGPVLCCLLGDCPCASKPPFGDSLGVGPTFVLTFQEFNTNVAPGGLDDDGDAKDVTVKSRASFKPSKGSDVGLNKRMKLKGKLDDGQAAVATEVEMTGNVTARLRVAVDALDGLVDGVTLGFLERRAVPDGPVKRVEALWNAGIDGFTLRAVDNGLPAGTTLDLPGAREAVLQVIDTGANFLLAAGEPTGDGLDELDPQADLAVVAQEPATESAVFAFGAEGLGKKASLWFAQFTLEFGSDVAAGPLETQIGTSLVQAQQDLEDAEELIELGATGEAAVLSMYNLLNSVVLELNSIDGAWNVLLAALEQGTLQPSTQGVEAEKNIKGALGLVFPASQDMFEAIQSGGTSIKPVKSHVLVGLKKVELAIAQIAGFKSNSHGKLEKALDFSIQ